MVEVSAIVCGVGIFLAVFIPTFVRELRTSKTSEAVENLRHLSERAAAYYAASHETRAEVEEPAGDEAEQEPEPARVESRRRCLPSTAGPTPRTPTPTPARVSFVSEDTPGHDTWRALGFDPQREVRFAYTFEPTASGCGLRSPEGSYLLTLRAEGDLDDDGERSLFERRMAANEAGELMPFGILYVRDRAE